MFDKNFWVGRLAEISGWGVTDSDVMSHFLISQQVFCAQGLQRLFHLSIIFVTMSNHASPVVELKRKCLS